MEILIRLAAADVDQSQSYLTFANSKNYTSAAERSTHYRGDFLKTAHLAYFLSCCFKVTLHCRVESSKVGTLEAKPDFL